jgi:hypothetical protein
MQLCRLPDTRNGKHIFFAESTVTRFHGQLPPFLEVEQLMGMSSLSGSEEFFSCASSIRFRYFGAAM